MAKGILKTGKVVVVLNGRYAGRKALVLKTYESGNGSRRFSHCIVAGLARYPRKTTKGMSRKKVEKKIKMKPFVRHVNMSHVFPTRYQVDFTSKLKELDLSDMDDSDKKVEARQTLRKSVKKIFEDRYKEGVPKDSKKSSSKVDSSRFFFQKLRF